MLGEDEEDAGDEREDGSNDVKGKGKAGGEVSERGFELRVVDVEGDGCVEEPCHSGEEGEGQGASNGADLSHSSPTLEDEGKPKDDSSCAREKRHRDHGKGSLSTRRDRPTMELHVLLLPVVNDRARRTPSAPSTSTARSADAEPKESDECL